ncbi:protein NRT1/ PTR FAMILY 2.3-like [Rhodamnia argentea]|uniref:Protein NRT1/ PTR FAMILY 2.3-like n=1 Tax=Rhodamnia argentea TaxID=178133 RepID=A0A8B8QJN9_9MYRT|nr:protein NRT1/ PTR FAMILY 2.3-like [Rhodamnia argentea]
MSGTRLTMVTLGANQFQTQQDQSTFINWILGFQFGSLIVGSTVIVYIEDSVSWGLGFWLCVAVNVIGLAIFLLGSRFYRHGKPRGSPFLTLARVVFASIRKRKITVTSDDADNYYYGQDRNSEAKVVLVQPRKNLRFFNREALKTEGDAKSDGSEAKSRRLCTVGEVQDLKTPISVLPLWLTAIFLATPMAAQSSLTILQALATDRHLGP